MKEEAFKRLSTGITGLDEILLGGLIPKRSYLVRGGPGVGKTTLGLHFLTANVDANEPTLFISLIKHTSDVRENAVKLGFPVRNITFLDMSPVPESMEEVQAPRLLTPSEVERTPLTSRIAKTIQQIHPVRLFIDSLTQMRYFASSEFDFQNLMFSILQFCLNQQATLLVSGESEDSDYKTRLDFLTDGVIVLAKRQEMRTITCEKYIGSGFMSDSHSMRLTDNGMIVFPRLKVPEMTPKFSGEMIPSNVPELDSLLSGGIERGLVTLISGSSGSGKTLVSLSFIHEAARRGERSVIYIYEEMREPLIARAEKIGIPLSMFIERNLIKIVVVHPLQFLPDEFSAMVREEVENHGARVVVIDNLSGYKLTLRDRPLVPSLHDLTGFLKSYNVTTLIVNDVEAITGDFRVTEIGVSFMADNVIFLRYLEVNGEMRKAIGVLKKRTGNFEKTLRQLEISEHGLIIGKPLTNLRGILLGVPEWVGPPNA